MCWNKEMTKSLCKFWCDRVTQYPLRSNICKRKSHHWYQWSRELQDRNYIFHRRQKNQGMNDSNFWIYNQRSKKCTYHTSTIRKNCQQKTCGNAPKWRIYECHYSFHRFQNGRSGFLTEKMRYDRLLIENLKKNGNHTHQIRRCTKIVFSDKWRGNTRFKMNRFSYS